MYFPSAEEAKMLQKDLVPRSREVGVAEELRGWNWHDAPLRPPYDVGLALYEVAGKYCPSARDLYLRRVCGAKSEPNSAMLAGSAYHGAVVQTIQEAKRLIYLHGPKETGSIAEGLREFQPLSEEKGSNDKAGSKAKGLSAQILEGIQRLKDFEATRIVARVEDTVSRQPYINADSLAATALPITCEHRLDGSFIGLSTLLSCDAASLGGTLVFDLKFGRKRDFHRLSATGYALVMESLWDYPVDIGCTVYVDMRSDVPTVTRDFFIISDELRQWFIDERDDKMRIVAEELDPGVAEECGKYCEFSSQCNPATP